MAGGRGVQPETAKTSEYKPAHERESGWDSYELDDAARYLEHAEKVKANPKFLAAVAAHIAKKAETHGELAGKIASLVKSGKISPKAASKIKG